MTDRVLAVRKWIVVVLLIGMSLLGLDQFTPSRDGRAPPPQSERRGEDITESFNRAADRTQVMGAGIVAKMLNDDDDGSRHQRFVLRLASGQTLLVAHNIDLAPRVAPLDVGDRVAFNGEYIWNQKGGTLHWTHHDPANRHTDGWLERDGRRFQ